ncbi:Pkinase-domain-containing protein [Histomonas meleagridis]|uniref:Pkinase-domain-containing protein n=1 Tax=Histomonas meleagridis TaxID=135588 RepID=UPI0035597CB9|nr:Pkinase-domain-containing protein [Histomonas meleagridis]KAH0802245.1 Pkinase-domain-containing protein [Histomonas meleagridis]
MECISPGTTINHSYQVIKRIGSGVSGTVYQAHDIYSQKDVAIKVYSVEHQETFNNEMNVIMNLYNDFIIRCYGSFTEEGVGECLVMEYADGGSLLDTLKTFHSLPEEVVKKYIMSILIALSEIHSKNYIHSDIKAANILIKDGVPKLSDFGVSSTINDNTLKGSPYWMSPETVLGLPQTDKSDIWSIGALMIELLTGKPPFASHPTSVALMLLQGLEVPEIPEHRIVMSSMA